MTLIVAPVLLLEAKLNVQGVYFPLSPIGNVNVAAPDGKIFVTPLSLETPFNSIRFDVLNVPAVVALAPNVKA